MENNTSVNNASADQVEVRFGGSSKANEGYVELNVNGRGWKGVCDDWFGINDAHVICRMKGYPEGAEMAYQASKPFGHGASRDSFAVDDLRCTGTELSIVECKHANWYTDNCSKGEWAAVKCTTADRLESVKILFKNMTTELVCKTLIIETVLNKMRLGSKYVINEKSTILFQSGSYFANLTY